MEIKRFHGLAVQKQTRKTVRYPLYEANDIITIIIVYRYKQFITFRIRCLDMQCVWWQCSCRIAVVLVLIHHLAVARRSTSIIYQKQLHVVASLNSTNDDSIARLKSSHKYPICPLWMYHKHHNSSCVCGSEIDNVIYCEDNQSTVSIASCYCMSYSDNGDGVVAVGACPFLCGN